MLVHHQLNNGKRGVSLMNATVRVYKVRETGLYG